MVAKKERENPGKPQGREGGLGGMETSWEIRSSLRCEWGTPAENTSYSLGFQDSHHTSDSYWSHEATNGCYLHICFFIHIHPTSHEYNLTLRPGPYLHNAPIQGLIQ